MRAAGTLTCEVDAKVMQFVLVGNPANAAKVKSHCDLQNEQPANLQAHFARSFESIQKLTLTKDDFRRITAPVLTIHGTFALPTDDTDLNHMGYVFRFGNGPAIYVTGDTDYSELLFAACKHKPDLAISCPFPSVMRVAGPPSEDAIHRS